PGAGAALLAAGLATGGHLEPGGPLPRHRRGPDRDGTARQLPPVRGARAAHLRSRPGAESGGARRADAAACGVAAGEEAADRSTAVPRTAKASETRVGPANRPARGLRR